MEAQKLESLELEIVGRGGSSLAALRKITPMSVLDNPVKSDLRVNVRKAAAMHYISTKFGLTDQVIVV